MPGLERRRINLERPLWAWGMREESFAGKTSIQGNSEKNFWTEKDFEGGNEEKYGSVANLPKGRFYLKRGGCLQEASKGNED